MFANLRQEHQQTNSTIFFEIRQQLPIVQISEGMDHVTRHAPFLHHWNAAITSSSKKFIRTADEKLIINKFGSLTLFLLLATLGVTYDLISANKH